MVKKTTLLTIVLSMLMVSCYDYKNSYWKSDHTYDLGVDYFGNGVDVHNVLCVRDRLTIETISKPGKTVGQLRDFFGFMLNGAALYLVVDTRLPEGSGGSLADDTMNEILKFKKDLNDGVYMRYERVVYPVWVVYCNNREDGMKLNGYYEGAGWYIYTNGDKEKFYTNSSDLKDVDMQKYIQVLVPREMTAGQGPQ